MSVKSRLHVVIFGEYHLVVLGGLVSKIFGHKVLFGHNLVFGGPMFYGHLVTFTFLSVSQDTWPVIKG